jgi:hypothetical protein
LGLLAFGVTIFLGLAAGNPHDVTLLRAVWAMLLFSVIGWSTGWVAYRVLDEHAIRKHREMFEDSEEQIESDEKADGAAGGGGAEPARA